MSLGGNLSMFERHVGPSEIKLGDCKWSVASKKGKKARTKEEASRSEEVIQRVQKDLRSERERESDRKITCSEESV